MDDGLILGELRAIRKEISHLREEMDRYRGFIWGVAWSFSAISGLIGFAYGVMKNGLTD